MSTARQFDADDPLRAWRGEFHLPQAPDGRELCYFLGNSLGPMPRQAERFVQAEFDSWRLKGLNGYFEGQPSWLTYTESLAEPMARIVGALPAEVAVMNTLTVNLHLALATFFRPTRQRYKILIEQKAFPSDHYALVSSLRLHGLDPSQALLIAPADPDSMRFDHEALCRLMREQRDALALILLPGVHYYTGQRFEIAALTRAAHEQGVPIGFDLAHAAGNIELALHDWSVDFAVWCNYKYLNAGPGAVGALYLHERHARDVALPRQAGWWGHERQTRFAMGPEFVPFPTAEGWQLSNSPILALAALRASLDIFDRVGGMAPLAAKSRRMTEFFRTLLGARCGDRVQVLTPEGGGCQLSLRVKDSLLGKQVQRLLGQAGIATDWREPDVIRAAPAPLYNTFSEIEYFVDALKRILDELG